MATIKMEVVAGAQTVSVTKTVSGADLLRFIAAYRAQLDPAATDEAVMRNWFDQVFNLMRKTTRQFELDQAAASVQQITLT